jgi:hypothetical protein
LDKLEKLSEDPDLQEEMGEFSLSQCQRTYNVQVKKVQADQYAQFPKHGRMLALLDPVIVKKVQSDQYTRELSQTW